MPADTTIISLTSIPPRFPHLDACLAGLLEQDCRPAEIQLWIPKSYRRFPDWDGALPQLPAGIVLHRCEDDYGPASKVLPALAQAMAGVTDILFCDDDVVYRPRWLRAFCDLRQHHATGALAGRAMHISSAVPHRQPRMEKRPVPQGASGTGRPALLRSGYADLLRGWGGVLLPTGWADSQVWELPPVLWTVDDVWLSGHLERSGLPIWCDLSIPAPVARTAGRHIADLHSAVIDDHSRQMAESACISWFRERYGIWPRAKAG